MPMQLPITLRGEALIAESAYHQSSFEFHTVKTIGETVSGPQTETRKSIELSGHYAVCMFNIERPERQRLQQIQSSCSGLFLFSVTQAVLKSSCGCLWSAGLITCLFRSLGYPQGTSAFTWSWRLARDLCKSSDYSCKCKVTLLRLFSPNAAKISRFTRST